MKTLFFCPTHLFFALYLFFFVQVAYAQIDKIYNDKNGLPTFIEFKDASFLTKKENLRLLSASNNLDDMAVFQKYLQTNENILFKLINQETDELGYTHRKYQQYFKDIKVEFSTYTVHTKGEKVNVINGKFTPIEFGTSTTPNISKADAIKFAINYFNTFESNLDLSSTLLHTDLKSELVFIQMNSEPRLAYKFNVLMAKPLSRNLIFVDAINGNILFNNSILNECFSQNMTTKNNRIETKNEVTTSSLTKTLLAPIKGSFPTRYSGNQVSMTDLINNTYMLRDYSRGKGIETYNVGAVTSSDTDVNIANAIDFTNNDNNWSVYSNNNKDDAAFDVHVGTQNTFDFFKNNFDRNSIDGNGYKLRSYLHFLKALGENYVNAFWTGEEMFYGDGDGVNFDPLVSQDVVSHELGHGFCQNTANLIYESESGALNEALSDIWGATIENYFYPNKKTWLMGEDFDLATHTGFRNMANPKAKGNPDTYRGKYWSWNMMYDHGGVHLNSGVINHWFFLVAQGGNGTNDFGVNYVVNGIGIMKAAKIVYRTETQYLSSQSEFLDFRIATIRAATDIYGINSKELETVKNAFAAVGLSSPLLPAQQSIYPTTCSIPNGQMPCGIAMTADNFYSGVYAASGIIANSSTKLFLATCNFNFTADLYIGFMQVKPNSSLILEAGKMIKIESGVRSNGGIGGLKIPYGSTFKAYICNTNNDYLVIKQAKVVNEEAKVIESPTLETSNTSLSVYPNPVTSNVTVVLELKELTKMNLVLTDIMGKRPLINVINDCVKETGIYNLDVDCRLLENGAYLMVLRTDKGTISQKIVVSR